MKRKNTSKRTQKTFQYLTYLVDTNMILPERVYPLPVPLGSLRLPPSKALTQCLDWAERALKETPKEIPKYVSRYLHATRKNPYHEVFWAELAVSVEFFIQFVDEPENADYYPKGVKVIQDGKRRDLERAIAWGRSLDVTELILTSYADAFDRCRRFCVANFIGHLPEPDASLLFTPADVNKVMKEAKGWVGILNYDHIRSCLLREAWPPTVIALHHEQKTLA